MRLAKCAVCTPDNECDDCFMRRWDERLDLDTTIKVIVDALSEENKKKFMAMSPDEQKWMALQAHADGVVVGYGPVKAR